MCRNGCARDAKTGVPPTRFRNPATHDADWTRGSAEHLTVGSRCGQRHGIL
jgi:hypothetical protein